jgi:hypothetical protein
MAPEKACKVIVACVVLFNISKNLNEPYLGRQRQLEIIQIPDNNDHGPAVHQGNAARARMVATFF